MLGKTLVDALRYVAVGPSAPAVRERLLEARAWTPLLTLAGMALRLLLAFWRAVSSRLVPRFTGPSCGRPCHL